MRRVSGAINPGRGHAARRSTPAGKSSSARLCAPVKQMQPLIWLTAKNTTSCSVDVRPDAWRNSPWPCREVLSKAGALTILACRLGMKPTCCQPIDVSPYFAVVKPALAQGFDFHTLNGNKDQPPVEVT